MKRFYTLLIALLAINSAMAQGCLPDGITFTTQEQIDNFQTDFPGCTEIEGYVYINGQGISNLNGLNSLISCGWLHIAYTSLIDLEGLNSLISTRRFTIEGNTLLTNFNGLNNLSEISGRISIENNTSLKTLSGLENLTICNYSIKIDANPALTNILALNNVTVNEFNSLTITNNINLTTCDIDLVCSYLQNPVYVEIYNNDIGCKNIQDLADTCGLTLPCLPNGVYIFTSQSEIDNFQYYFPGCTALSGSVTIQGWSITNLIGLNSVTSISGGLSIIQCNGLEKLNGLENLTSIGGELFIYSNKELKNLEGLKSLNSIGNKLSISYNESLTTLEGLENINANTISKLFITGNSLLSDCEVQSVCDFLEIPGVYSSISLNASGCDSIPEVMAACALSVENIIQENDFSIFPNPSTSRFNFQFNLDKEEQVKLLVLNNLGQVVATLANERLSTGQNEINWNAEGMPAGIYFYNIQIGNQPGTGKMVLMK